MDGNEKQNNDVNELFNLEIMKPLIKKIGMNTFLIGLVFFFQNAILTGFMDRANLKNSNHPDDFAYNYVKYSIIMIN